MTLNAIQEQILKTIAKRRDAVVEDLQNLVRIPSLTGHEGPVQDYMRSRLSASGMQLDCFEADPDAIAQHPAYVPLPREYAGRPNVVGTWGAKSKGRSLILNGHVDVVSAEPLALWKHEPFGADVENSKLYGRGSADMKGGLAAGLAALDALRACGLEVGGQLIFESVIEEEAGGSGGTLACFLRGYRADAMLVPEPQSRIAISHVGVVYFRICVYGQSAHAGLAHTGTNAIGKMNLIYDALTALDQERGRQVHYPAFDRGSGRSCHICLGKYRAGDWPSTVAGAAELEGRISFIPGETAAGIRELVESTVHRAAMHDEWLRNHPPQIEWFGWHTEPWQQDGAHPFVRTLIDATTAVQGRPAEVIGKAAAMDTRFGSYFGTAAASYGVDGGNIHGVDEYVEIDSIVRCAQVIALTITSWCGIAD